MRPIQSLYFDHGRIFCPTHGNKYIQFMTDDGAVRKLYWHCAAVLPDGTSCVHSAAWDSLADINDAELEALALDCLNRQLH